MPCLLRQHLLADNTSLQEYLRGGRPTVEDILRRLFLRERNLNTLRPDHFYLNRKELAFTGRERLSELLLSTIGCLSGHFLDFRGERLLVRNGWFADWQHLLPRFPPLPMVSFAVYRRFGAPRKAFEEIGEYCYQNIAPHLSRTTLPSPFLPHLEGIIRDHGLRELHIHLNGTTEFDFVWLHTLQNLGVFHDSFQEALADPIVREQFEQIEPGLTVSKVFNRLRLAARLRQCLAEYLFQERCFDDDPDWVQRISNLDAMPFFHDDLTWYSKHPLEVLLPRLDIPDSVREGLFHILMFHALERLGLNHEHIAAAYHLYLLLLGFFNIFLVQQVEQNGFDQFQKIANNEGRTASERSYSHRFRQIAGISGRDVRFLEGRFSPKDTVLQNLELLDRIFRDYDKYRGETNNDKTFRAGKAGGEEMELRLVAHFIKKRDPKRPGDLRVRHHDLRVDLRTRGQALLAARDKSPRLKSSLTGIDAAANELHAGPEVFAPVYRMFRRAGLVNFTFHVGEDFIHLLSGIRAIYEAVHFLDLKNGNRIGHGTAVGIAPERWLKVIGPAVVISKQEWLDDLVFACAMLEGEDGCSGLRADLRNTIEQLVSEIYGAGPERGWPLSVLTAAWRMRFLDPLLACCGFAERADLLDLRARAEEWDAIERAKSTNIKAFNLFREYHRMDNVRRGRKMIEVETGLFDKDLLKRLQQKVVRELHQREVVIESMLTSNVRISCYRDYREHHLWRWLGLEGDDKYLPAVCLATDDPGIFATNLRNEYAHLYEALNTEFHLSPAETIRRIKELCDNAGAYCFGG